MKLDENSVYLLILIEDYSTVFTRFLMKGSFENSLFRSE